LYFTVTFLKQLISFTAKVTSETFRTFGFSTGAIVKAKRWTLMQENTTLYRLYLRSNVVYRLNCSCGLYYIGLLGRNLIKRFVRMCINPSSTLQLVDFCNLQILTSLDSRSKIALYSAATT